MFLDIFIGRDKKKTDLSLMQKKEETLSHKREKPA